MIYQNDASCQPTKLKIQTCFNTIALDKVNKFELGVFQKGNEKIKTQTMQKKPNQIKKDTKMQNNPKINKQATTN